MFASDEIVLEQILCLPLGPPGSGLCRLFSGLWNKGNLKFHPNPALAVGEVLKKVRPDKTREAYYYQCGQCCMEADLP
jgi:hypothetical protein